MATYKKIQEWVKNNYGFEPKTCWIAHVKEICGFEVKKAPNRLNDPKRDNPCPPEKIKPIKNALKYFREL